MLSEGDGVSLYPRFGLGWRGKVDTPSSHVPMCVYVCVCAIFDTVYKQIYKDSEGLSYRCVCTSVD